jgi:hypothetical protein
MLSRPQEVLVTVSTVCVLVLCTSVAGEQLQFHSEGSLFAVNEVINVKFRLELKPLEEACSQWQKILKDEATSVFAHFTGLGRQRANDTVQDACLLIRAFPGIAQLPYEVRPQRQILSSLAVFSLGSIFGSISDHLFGHSNFEELHIAMTNLHDQFAVLQRHVSRAEAMLTTLKEELKEVNLLSYAEHFLETVQRTSTWIDQLYHAQLPLQFLAGVEPQELFTQLQKHAQARQLMLPFSSFDQLIQLPITFSALPRNVSLMVTLAVPLIRQQFSLYHLIQDEVVVQHKNTTAIVTVDVPSPYLALSSNKAEFATFSSQELAGCYQFHNSHFCRISALYKNMSDTCISSLYHGNFPSIDRNCNLRPVNKDRHLLVTDSSILVYSQDSLAIMQHCENTTVVTKVRGLKHLPRLSRCSYDSVHFYVPPLQTSSGTVTYVVETTWDWHVLGPDFSLEQLPKILDDLRAQGYTPESTLHGLISQHDVLLRNRQEASFNHIWLVIVCAGVGISLLLVLLFLCYVRWSPNFRSVDIGFEMGGM